MICRCDCGNNKEVRATNLTKKDQPTRSCGCIQRAACAESGRKTIKQNAAESVMVNKKFQTNFHMIESGPPINNTSGVKGVSWCRKRRKWEAYISVHNKRIYLGRFFTKEAAIAARKNAEEIYFAPLLKQKNEEIHRASGG